MNTGFTMLTLPASKTICQGYRTSGIYVPCIANAGCCKSQDNETFVNDNFCKSQDNETFVNDNFCYWQSHFGFENIYRGSLFDI